MITLWLSSFCSPTELFTTNKHVMYYMNTLYHMAVFDETILFDTMEEKYRSSISVFLLKLFVPRE